LGSGFVTSYDGNFYIVTNYHVTQNVANLSVTFSDGDSYAAKVVGSDPYSDLTIVEGVGVPVTEYHALNIVSSSNLQIGEPIVAIGNPFGLSGSITVGIISQLGRTIQDPTAGNYSIADVIQFSAPINPGNSGGPLLDAAGQVIGITTATISGSEGVGFAIPSDTVLRELPSLVANGTYDGHPYLGIGGTTMDYLLAEVEGSNNYTYGVLIETLVSDGPAASAGLRAGNTTETIEGEQYLIGGDIIVSINGTKIATSDALDAYLESYCSPGESVVLGVIRSGQEMSLNVVLGTRPPI
jgi:S1-C subfamily serine protease